MNDGRRIVFFGTGAYFSVVALEYLIESGFPPNAIVLPEYPAAKQSPSLGDISVQTATAQNPLIKMGKNVAAPIVFAPGKTDSYLSDKLSEFEPDFILVVCWPYLIPEAVYAIAQKAALNLHPSLLPAYRGANPVEDQLRAGETRLGVSLHLLNSEFDAGDIVKQRELDFSNKRIDAQQIEKRAARAGIDSFIESINEFGSSKWRPKKQSSKTQEALLKKA